MSQNVLYLKLVTGENIVSVCAQDPNDKESIMLKHPLEIHTENMSLGARVRLSKWIPHIKKMQFSIHSDDIIVMERPIEAIIDYYNEGVKVLKTKVIEKKTETQIVKLDESTREDMESSLIAMMEYLSNTAITIH